MELLVKAHNKVVKLVPLRSTGQNLSCGFVVLLLKGIPQSHNLNSAVYHGVKFSIWFSDEY